ncbi:MAG: DUF1109 domain-containing protein [Betaproteobacteria bacterium]
MKTEELVTLLANGVVAVDPHVAARRYALALGAGAIGALALLLMLLGVRSDLREAVSQPLFWIKIGFVASLLAASLFAALRLSRPGMRLDAVPVALAAPVVALWIVAGITLLDAEASQRSALLLGQTWKSCPWLIALLSTPVFVGTLWAMRGLAPTRPRLAGFAAGLLAGATAALVYCLHCPEVETPFIGVWYVLGMAIPAGVGAALGERLLRW